MIRWIVASLPCSIALFYIFPCVFDIDIKVSKLPTIKENKYVVNNRWLQVQPQTSKHYCFIFAILN